MNKKIKIGFLTFPNSIFKSKQLVKSGSIIVNSQIINYLEKHGFEVIRFCPRNNNRVALRNIIGFGNALIYQELLKQIDQINQCDVIITTNYFGLVLPEIKKPIITIFHHSAQSIAGALEDDRIYTDENLKKWLHNATEVLIKTDELLHSRVSAAIENYQIRHSAKVVAVSHNLKKEIVENYKVQANKIEVIENGFIPPNFKTQRDFDGKLKLISVTRIPNSVSGFTLKGIDRICELFSHASEFDNFLVASTNASAAYKKFFNRYLKKTEINFNLAHKQVIKKFSQTHISLHLSRLEAFGLTLIEAMSTGNVPIAFPTGISSKIIKNGENGFIARNLEDIFPILKMINKNNFRKRLANMSENACRTVANKINDIDKMAGEYEKLIRSIVHY